MRTLIPKDWKKRIDDLLSRAKSSPIYSKIKPYASAAHQWWEQVSGDVVGLDIGQDSVRLLKINNKNDSFEVESYAAAPLPVGAVTKDEIKDYVAVGEVVKEMFKQSHLTIKQVAFAMPRSLAIIKNITIDSRLTPEDIESRAWIEANRHFPDLIGDIYLDFVVSKPSTQDPTQLELTLVACRKDHLKPYLEIAKQSGVTAKIIDVDCYALERALHLVMPTIGADEVVALLNINTNISTLIVVRDSSLIYAHDQTYDGQRLITQTAKYLQEKQINGEVSDTALLQDEGYNNLLKEILISHLRHTIHFFYSSRPNIAIQKIMICGDCATVPGLAPFIENEIGVKASVANPAENLTLAADIDAEKFKKDASSLMLCCGLALSKRSD